MIYGPVLVSGMTVFKVYHEHAMVRQGHPDKVHQVVWPPAQSLWQHKDAVHEGQNHLYFVGLPFARKGLVSLVRRSAQGDRSQKSVQDKHYSLGLPTCKLKASFMRAISKTGWRTWGGGIGRADGHSE